MHLNTPWRSRLARTAALAIGTLSVAGMALVGTGPSASATTTAAAPVTGGVERIHPEREAEEICIEVSSRRRGGDEDCGDSVQVSTRRAIRSVALSVEEGDDDERVCVLIRGMRARDIDCADDGDTASASIRRDATVVALLVEDTRLCGRASSDDDWGRITCSRPGGWLILHRGGDELDGLQVWVRGGHRP